MMSAGRTFVPERSVKGNGTSTTVPFLYIAFSEIVYGVEVGLVFQKRKTFGVGVDVGDVGDARVVCGWIFYEQRLWGVVPTERIHVTVLRNIVHQCTDLFSCIGCCDEFHTLHCTQCTLLCKCGCMLHCTSMTDAENTRAEAFALHKELRGKIEITTRAYVNKDTLPLLYTPGVGAVAQHCAKHPEETNDYTWRGKTVAVVSDGSAVLGLGNIGPEGALPVMEGKALLFREYGGLFAVPVVLAVHTPEEIIAAVEAIAPSFGAINLEDIAAPKCFVIERELKKRLAIPVMHDDQHGTAVVVLAGLINAHTVVQKNIATSRIAIVGAGAAGNAIARLLVAYGVGDVVVVDSKGIVAQERSDMDEHKHALATITNREHRQGSVLEAVAGSDVVVGVSGPGSILPEHVRLMAQKPIVFALANPTPEIFPHEAHAAGAMVVATGRSDFPNQINNVLSFPGIFRGCYEHRVRQITQAHHIAAAEAIAGLVARPTRERIVPSATDRRVAKAVAGVIGG
jgi:malate dehydrogenase (oxaloacetate-decarboxylating)